MDWKRLKANPDYWRIFKLRARIIDKTRQFFKKEGFLEIETPLLAFSLIPESYLEVFETELRDKLGKKKRAFLIPSPEIWHKKLLAAGSGNLFEITKSFRNTDIDSHFHNPEFTLLEWYRTGVSYQETMKDCQRLIQSLVRSKKITYQGRSLDLNSPFERISVKEAFKKYAGINRAADLSREDFSLIYVDKIEPNLGQKRPTIIYNFPKQFAPLAKISKNDSRVKERFELYLFGIELADAYSELTDPVEQKKEFRKEITLRKEQGKTDYPTDWDFIKALEQGLPQCSGVALGIDRLVMILANKKDISEVILFSIKDLFN